MFALLSGNEKKTKKEVKVNQSVEEARELFNLGRFPVVTTQIIESRPIAKVLGLVCCRGFDSEEAFFGMAAMAVKKGAQGIIGYNENVAFHPDGSKYFSCFGTAVMFHREGRSDLATDRRAIRDTLNNIPNALSPNQKPATDLRGAEAGDKVSLNLLNEKQSVLNSAFAQNSTQASSAQIGAQSDNEDKLSFATRNTSSVDSGRINEKPSEEDDPVLQRLLASQKRQAPQNWQ